MTLIAAYLSIALALPSASPTPSVRMANGAAVVQIGEISAALSSADAGIVLRTPQGDCALTPSIQLGASWTRPAAGDGHPTLTSTAKAARVTLNYAVADRRTFRVTLEARSGIPAIFVTSRLGVLDEPRAQYYFWQTSLSGDRCALPEPGSADPISRSFRTGEWDQLPDGDWWLPLGAGRTGGVAILPTNVGGRAPGTTGSVFIHALPRSALVEPGHPLTAAFGLFAARDPAEAAHVAALSRRAGLPAQPASAPLPRRRPAPRWLRDADRCAFYYRPAADWTDEIIATRLRGFPIVVGSTPDRAALERCHRAGIRLLHYVCYTCLLDTARQAAGGGRIYSEWTESIGHAERDLKDHPDWVCIDERGAPQADAWGAAHGHPGLLNTCLHQADLRRAAVKQVRDLMTMGFDGVFVDLAGPTVECHGPRCGRHTHPDAARSNTGAYEQLLREIYAAVRSFGPDRAVVHNTCTDTMPGHWASCDAQLLEAWPLAESRPSVNVPWSELRRQIARNATAIAAGKRIMILPYFTRDAAAGLGAAWSHAFARITDLLWCEAVEPEREPLARSLGSPIGQARSPAVAAPGVLARQFRHGRIEIDTPQWPASPGGGSTPGARITPRAR